MKIRFNHVILATIAIVFVVTFANAINAQQNLVSNNQSSPAEPRESMANNANSTMSIQSTASPRQLKMVNMKIPKVAGKLINPVRRNNNFKNRISCKDLGLATTSTGECKQIFVDGQDGPSLISNELRARIIY